MSEIEEIVKLARAVESNPDYVGVLSTGERIVVALLFNRIDWLPEGYTNVLDGIARLGETWFVAVLAAHQIGWRS